MGAVRTGTRGRRAVPWAVVGLWVAAPVLLGPHAVRTVAAGDALLSPGPTARLIERLLRSPAAAPVTAGPDCLSDREREVLTPVARGLNDTEIAETLGLSPLTAKTHVSRTMGKPGARDRVRLVVVAYESGLVAPGAG